MAYYLRCKYFNRAPMLLLENEYTITFKSFDNFCPKPILDNGVWPPGGEQWIIVNRRDVLAKKNGAGLVKLVDIRMEEDKNRARVYIHNSPDGRADCFNVPIEEIVAKK